VGGFLCQCDDGTVQYSAVRYQEDGSEVLEIRCTGDKIK
jgi:hypothetical protein